MPPKDVDYSQVVPVRGPVHHVDPVGGVWKEAAVVGSAQEVGRELPPVEEEGGGEGGRVGEVSRSRLDQVRVLGRGLLLLLLLVVVVLLAVLLLLEAGGGNGGSCKKCRGKRA